MKISYAITVKDELEEIKRLVDFLLLHKRQEDEIIILVDISKEDNGELRGWLNETKQSLLLKGDPIKIYEDQFKGHFADWKNQLNSYCTGDYIFQIDADEIPNKILLEHLDYMLQETPEADILLVPRINTVEGLTPEHIKKWGWNVNEKGWVNFPDYQWRIYRNCPEIKWVNKVHEKLEGFKSYCSLPIEHESYCLYHPKTIDKQEKQNNYYSTL
jgi:glycosyltransferase involved in cell wall biosynthesis